MSDGRPDSQRQAKAGADLVELLAYSGCRIQEATSHLWSDVDFDKNALSITGGQIGTKNRELRTIPMTGALKGLLLRLCQVSNPAIDPIAVIHGAKKCLTTASRRLSYPRFTHHDFRLFFATACIESARGYFYCLSLVRTQGPRRPGNAGLRTPSKRA